MDLPAALNDVLHTLTANSALSVPEQLVSIKGNEVSTPLGNAISLFAYRGNSSKSAPVDMDGLKNLVARMSGQNALIRLNHIGFCYKAESIKEERKRLAVLMKNSPLFLYEEPSNDEGAWLFVGNVRRWEDMMVELIPVEKTNDPYADFWLPHIQIDVDTDLNEFEIFEHVKTAFGDRVVPFPIRIEGVVYIVRCRLGSVEGVNMMLDLATVSRNVRYQRLRLLKKVIL